MRLDSETVSGRGRGARFALLVGLVVCVVVVGMGTAGATAVWSIVSNPNPAGSTSSALFGVACPSTTSCDAVGNYVSGAVHKPLAKRWNGSKWMVVASPNPSGSFNASLYGVACPSIKSCTAVGYYSSGAATRPLIEHWNGVQWKIVPGATATGLLDGIACASATNCNAVGNYNLAGARALAEHWNGTKWTVVPTPNPLLTTLSAVACTSVTSCTAVGTDSVEDTLVLHWNGTKWTRQTSPNPPVSATSSLFGVACITATNCEAVGAYTWTSARRGFIEHWNGTNWAIVTTPNPTGANSGLGGVACASAALCNAVGYYTVGTVTKSLVLQRNGIKWSIVASPNPKGATQTILNAVACASTPTCNGQHGNPTVTDAVGQSGPALAPTSTSLIERYG